MSNLLEYVFSLKDKMSDKLSKLSINSEEALDKFAALEKASKKVQKTMDVFGGSIGALREKLQHLRNEREWIPAKNIEAIRAYNKEIKNLEKEISKLETLNGGRFRQWREDFMGSLPGANLIKNPLVLAGAAIGGFWSATSKAMDAGKEKIKLQTLVGSKEIGETLYKGLTDFATDTVFGSEVYDMGVQMLANGIKDSEVMPLMNMLGDISMGDSQKLGQLSLAFAQINGKGKLAGQELLQLINAGFNPLQVIVDKTGESMESLQDKMSKGAISVEHVRWAMELATGPGGKFHNMLQDVANTPYGQLENLRGELDQLLITLGEVFIPIASKVMRFFSWLSEKLGPLIKPLGIAFAVIAAGILATAAATAVLDVVAAPLFPFVALIVAVGAAVVIAIRNFETWGAAVLFFSGPLGQVVSLVYQFYKHWEDVKNAFKTGGIKGALESIGRVLTRWLLDPVKQLLELIAKIPGKVGAVAQSGIDAIDRLNQGMDEKDRSNRYWAALEETKNKIAAGKHQRYLDALEETKNKIAGKSTIAPVGGLPGVNNIDGSNGGRSNIIGNKTNDAIATGGTKSTTINITMKNLVEAVNIMKNNGFKESANDMSEEVQDALLRSLAMAATTAT